MFYCEFILKRMFCNLPRLVYICLIYEHDVLVFHHFATTYCPEEVHMIESEKTFSTHISLQIYI